MNPSDKIKDLERERLSNDIRGLEHKIVVLKLDKIISLLEEGAKK